MKSLETTKPKISTPWKKIANRKKFVPGISLAVPGQSQKLKDLLNQYNVGIPKQGYRLIYSQDINQDLGINPKMLDYVDIQHLSEENLKRINKLEAERRSIIEDYNREKAEREQIELENRIAERLKKELEVPKP